MTPCSAQPSGAYRENEYIITNKILRNNLQLKIVKNKKS